MAVQILSNARIVTPDENFVGSVIIEDDIIVVVEKGTAYDNAIDLKGQWLIPGCIDIHSDYLEKELYPAQVPPFRFLLLYIIWMHVQ